MFYVWKLKRIVSVFLSVISIFFITFSWYKMNNTENNIEVFNVEIEPTYKIVIDAGHGEPDGGAVSKNGIAEAGLNLSIALKLKEVLENNGYEIVLTRKNEQNVASADKQTPIRTMKVSDINKRIQIANECSADMLISIHMNNFENPKYYGWQTFYKKGSKVSEEIAKNIQEGISNQIERKNNRVALPITNIKLIDKSTIPAVIVECGFLSNEEDLRLLLTEEYQMQIVNGIVEGINKIYEIN